MNKATWIWYPGDFEVWLGNIFNNRRTERGAMFPPFWKQDSHWVTVEFSKAFTLDEDETITIACEGQFNLALDGKLQFGQPKTFLVPKGEHKLNLKVWNQATPPALYIDGDTIKTDSTWLATYEDKLWIDENGIAHGSGSYVPAASWNFNSPDTPPSAYRLNRLESRPLRRDSIATNGTLYDFGRETFGYLKVKDLKGTVRIYYGESREEALDRAARRPSTRSTARRWTCSLRRRCRQSRQNRDPQQGRRPLAAPALPPLALPLFPSRLPRPSASSIWSATPALPTTMC